MCDDILDLDEDQKSGQSLLPKNPPSLLIAVLMGLQGQYQNPKETVLFPVDPLFTILRQRGK